MTYYTDETQTQDHNGHAYTIRLVVDQDPDTSCLGEYVREADTFCVWRQDGTLRGDYPTEPERPSNDASDATWEAYDDLYDAWQDAEPVILADDLSTMDRNEYAYFASSASGVKPEENVTEWAKYAERDYARMEDLHRNFWCYVGVVVSVDVPACATCGHVETLGDSLWGIESDSGDEYFDSIVNDLISELESQLDKRALAVDAGIVL